MLGFAQGWNSALPVGRTTKPGRVGGARGLVCTAEPAARVGRRAILLAPVVAGITAASAAIAEEVASETKEYRSSLALGFTFEYPNSWSLLKKKPIKTHVAEVQVAAGPPDPSSNTVGVIVDPVKIKSLTQFGTPEEVAERIIGIERKKEGNTMAEVLRAERRNKESGVKGVKEQGVYYLIEYVIDGTRGKKHFLAEVSITGDQLYAITGQTKEADWAGAKDTIEKIIDSFLVKLQFT